MLARMMDDLSPGAILSTGIPGSLALVAANYARVDWVRDCLLCIGIVLACYAVAILLMWLRETWISQQERVSNMRDRIYALAHEARYLTPEQIKFIVDTRHIGTDRDLAGEVFLHGTDVPLWFVEDFLGRCYTYRLYAVRNYSEGTDEREWARQITAVLVGGGYAMEAAGNQSAAWAEGISPQVIADKLGLNRLPHSTDTPPEGGEVAS